MGLQIHLINLTILVIVTSIPSSLSGTPPNCSDLCGNVTIPYPFGTTAECPMRYGFLLTCNQTFDPPRLFFYNTNTQITGISLDGQLTILQHPAFDCYDQNRTSISNSKPSLILWPFTVNNTANKLTIVGCDTFGSVHGHRLDARDFYTGCTAMCGSNEDMETGSCTALGCCQTSIPKQVWQVKIHLQSYNNYSYVAGTNKCSYAFIAEEGAFTFSAESYASLSNVQSLPMVVDWTIGHGTCEKARMNSSDYACKSANSSCYKPDNGGGYRCSCMHGYRGNPYLVDGCQDIDECLDPRLNNCEKTCENELGSFYCVCPKGYHGDGRKDGHGCIRGESLVFKLVAGVAVGIIALLVPICWLHMRLRRRRLIKTRRKFFLLNGGLLLHEKLSSRDASSSSAPRARIFSASELHKATRNFDSSAIIGRGGFGTVYKGVLSDEQVVAIKKSREVVDPRQIEQFINEVIVLSQINHRNVVKLLGCCLETQAPLLVYEFVSNGTLSEHVHDEAKACFLSWGTRLRIAAETAGVLSYLHSQASTPIIHRDVKSANILLDQDLTAKVSDFGASRLVPLDQSQLSTLVQGTFGYLDPEYMQTNRLSEKSDVYSFGVVLLELLTGRKAVSNDRPEEERGLAFFFLYVMEQDGLFEVVEPSIMREEIKEQLMEVAILAKQCLNVKGEERPSMREVEMVLEGVRAELEEMWLTAMS
ncbi:hypothetical protein ACS0TY_032369 [Phlomoides rotata]